MTDAAISVDGLVKRYGDRTAVDGVSLEVRPGEVVALLGPNGAGKTTTVEVIEGYRRGDGGTVRVLGTDPIAGGRALRARVGLMLQSGGVDMRARPRETIEQYAAFHEDGRGPDDLLDLLGLTAVAGTPYRRLSGGERQRLGLALAFVGRPEVLVLDEPTAGMDPEGRAATRALVADARADGAAILLTSHDLTEVERTADRIVILVDGRVVASGTPAQLVSGLRPRLRLRLDRPVGSDEIVDLRTTIGGGGISVDGDRVAIDDLAPTPELLALVARWAAGAGLLIVESRSTGGSLEDAYLDLVDRAS